MSVVMQSFIKSDSSKHCRSVPVRNVHIVHPSSIRTMHILHPCHQSFGAIQIFFIVSLIGQIHQRKHRITYSTVYTGASWTKHTSVERRAQTRALIIKEGIHPFCQQYISLSTERFILRRFINIMSRHRPKRATQRQNDKK